MAFQIKVGTLTLVVPTASDAIEMVDRLRDHGSADVTVNDMDGRKLDPKQLVDLAGNDLQL